MCCAINKHERNLMERNKTTLTLLVKIKHVIRTKISREDGNFNVEKGFFLQDDECDLRRISQIECCSSASSAEKVDADLKLNEVNTIKNIDEKPLSFDGQACCDYPTV